ncbi:hypothetical protein AALM99_04745 [Lactococcus muris]|uniref:Phage protein n=1 Tax=Lactococcus muris TaxID=2941330 RepID=A0ABV4D9W2_9LACT
MEKFEELLQENVALKEQLEKVKKQRDEARKRAIEVIDKFQGEAGAATGGDVDRLVFSGLDVHAMLNEIEFVIEEALDEEH